MAKRNTTTKTTTPVTTTPTAGRTSNPVPAGVPTTTPAAPTVAQLQAQLQELQGLLATRQNHQLVTSTLQRPVHLVRTTFYQWVNSGKPLSRKGVINACVAMGVAPNTAKTQYQLLSKAYKNGTLVVPPQEG
jgi:hypothetical protein